MSTPAAHPGDRPARPPREGMREDDLATRDPVAARPVVYLVVGAGIVVALLGMLLDLGPDFSLATPMLAVLAAVPYLVYAALAMRQPGAEAVVAGVLLFGVGSWGYLGLHGGDIGALMLLPLYLTGMVVAIFLLGGALRITLLGRR